MSKAYLSLLQVKLGAAYKKSLLLGLARELSGLEHHPSAPRLRVQSPDRAHTRSNK